MQLHEKAWEGLNILIFGKTPLLPMQIEQEIAECLPHVEISLNSFEVYTDALTFCKSNKSTGLILFLGSDDPLMDLQEIVQLAKPYNTKGFKAYSVYIDTKESLSFKKRIIFPQTVISGYELEDFNEVNLHKTLEKIWDSYTSKVYNNLLGKNLEITLRNIISKKGNYNELDFNIKLTNLLVSKLNVSWLESVSLKLNCLIDPILKIDDAILSAHKDLLFLNKSIRIPNFQKETDIIEYLLKRNSSKISEKIAVVKKFLTTDSPETLKRKISTISRESKPGASGIVQIISQNSDFIKSYLKTTKVKKA